MRFVLFGLFVAAFASISHSAVNFAPSDGRITVGEWTLTPILEHRDDLPPKVHSFLGFVDKSQTSGENLTAVWFVRSGDEPNGWNALAWQSQEQWQAIAYIKSVLSIAPEYDAVWRTADDKPEVMPSNPEAPVTYGNGVLSSDPLSTYLNSTTYRDEIVSALVALGYKAADIPFEKLQVAVQCESGDIKDNFAEGVEADEAVQGDGGGAFEVSNRMLAGCGVFCLPLVWTAPAGPWGGWINPPESSFSGPCTIGTPPNSGQGCCYRVTHKQYRPMVVYHLTPTCTVVAVTTYNIIECYTSLVRCPNPGAGPCTPCLWVTIPAAPPPGVSPSWICF